MLPTCWGKGYGAALMTSALQSLQEQGYRIVTLWVLDGNQRAIRFYEAAGFAADGQTQEEILPGGVTVRELRYRRPLLRT
ncbi:MAG: GNAT family N-acetyltransferase [Caldilineaceae bacterium]